MIRTAIRWGLVLLLLPALVLVGTAPAPAQFIDPSNLQIIANQITQIAQAVTMIAVLRDSDRKLSDQIAQLREQALGTLPNAALPQSIQQISSDATKLIDTAQPWIGDFSGVNTLQIVQALTDLPAAGKDLTALWRGSLATADTVGEADVAALFSDPLHATAAREGWRLQRDNAERQIAGAHAILDAAEELAERLAAAQDSLEDLRGQTNLSGTALQQALLGGQLTDSEVAVALNQLLAFQAIRDSQEQQARELAFREALGRWHTAELDARTQNDASINWLQANADAMGQGLLLPTAYGNR